MYQDMGSRHGSKLQLKERTVEMGSEGLREPIAVFPKGTLVLGTTMITFEVQQLYGSHLEGGASQVKFEQDGVECLTTMQLPDDGIPATLAYCDARMDILFQLGKHLNGLTQLNEILSLICEAAFEALSTAATLAINQIQEGELTPLLVRSKTNPGKDPVQLLLNPEILKKALEEGKAVLFGPEATSNKDPRVGTQMRPGGICAPLMGQESLLGVIIVHSKAGQLPFDSQDLDWFSVLASMAAFALERTSLNQAIYRMFEGFVQASVGAIEARDPTTAGHSQRVAKYALALTQAVNNSRETPFADKNFTPAELTELRYAALLHDFGKVCVRKEVLVKSARLSDSEMEQIHHRFRLLRSEYQCRMTDEILRKTIDSGKVPTQETFTTLYSDSKRFGHELDLALQRLENTRAKWRLEPKEIAYFEKLGARRLEALDGGQHVFLTERELENMIIPIGTLNEREWEEMRAHVVESESFLSRIPWSKDLREIPSIAGAHHEKLDGSGYPKGLKGPSISTQARILTIADIFDACTAWDRPYCQPLGLEETVQLLRKEAAENKLDENLVQLFVARVIPDIKHIAPRQ